MKHQPIFRIENRKGMRFPEVRVSCSCGNWQDKALTEKQALATHSRHANRPERA